MIEKLHVVCKKRVIVSINGTFSFQISADNLFLFVKYIKFMQLLK